MGSDIHYDSIVVAILVIHCTDGTYSRLCNRRQKSLESYRSDFCGHVRGFLTLVYFIELTVIAPHIFSRKTYKVALPLFNPGSFMTGLDALGYLSMSLATLFAAPVFVGGRLEHWI